MLGVDYKDMFLYFLDPETKEIVTKTPISEITRAKEKKTKLTIDFGKDASHDFEGDKKDIKELFEAVERAKNLEITTQTHESSIATPQNNFQSPSVKTAPSKVAVALYDYHSTEEGEISINEGDNLLVVDDTDEEWWMVRFFSEDGEGLVPKTYVKIISSTLDSNMNAALNDNVSNAHQRSLERKTKEENARRLEEEGKEKELKRLEETQRNINEDKRLEDLRKSQQEDRKKLDVDIEERRNEESKRIANEESVKPVIPSRKLRESVRLESIAIPERAASKAPEIPQIPQRPIGAVIPPVPERHKTESISNLPERPAIPVRPTRAEAVAPALPSRTGSTKTIIRPQAPVSRPIANTPSQALTQSSRNDDGTLLAAGPDLDKIREWTDKSGTFKVEAAYIALVDNKVQLHKINGVKIAVPLDKLSTTDIEYLKRIPGNESMIHSSSALSIPIPTPPTKVKNSSGSNMPNPDHVYNNFDWRDWLIKAGIASIDASAYAKTFVEQRFDQSCLHDVDRETLRSMQISEGDIIRIRKAANLPYVTKSFQDKAAVNESRAQKHNLEILQGKRDSNQIAEDEAFARNLQAKEQAQNYIPNPVSIKLAESLLKPDAGNTNNKPHGISQSRSFSPATFPMVQHDPWAITETISTIDLKRQELETQRKADEAQKTLEKAQQAIAKAQEQARQAALLENQTKALRHQQQQNEAALAQAQETARKALLMQHQAEQKLVEAQKNANIAAQQPFSLPVQPRMAVPLIPTPSAANGSGFVPTSFPKHLQIQEAGINRMGASGTFSGPHEHPHPKTNEWPGSKLIFNL